jgi:hypothetical protein
MTTTYRPAGEPAPRDNAARHDTPGTARRVTGALRLLAALVMGTAIASQIADQIAAGVFEPARYFSFFTVQTGLLNVAVLLAGAVVALRARHDSERFTAVRLCAVTYAAVTGVVYNLLLRDIPTEGDFVAIAWPGEIEHVWIPVYIVLDWLLAPGRARLGWGRVGVALAYPLLWVAFTLVRGNLEDWYPYPFLDPAGPGGWGGVWLYVAAISVFIVVVAVIGIVASRANRRGAGDRELSS